MYQADIEITKQLLLKWLEKSTSANAMDWIRQKQHVTSSRDFYLAFGAAPRFTGKTPLQVTTQDLQEAQQLRKGLSPASWTIDQATRILFMLSLPHREPATYLQTLDQLFATAEVSELVALYSALPLLPHPELFRAKASDGIRSNISSVFNAVALENPYPAEYFEEGPWNQLVLKAIFIGSPLHRIYGLDQRTNPTLARILSDFAHERWAAKRPVTPELWRCVGPFLNEQLLPDIEKLFRDGNEKEQEAAALACRASTFAPAKTLLQNKRPDLAEKINKDELFWEALA
jgi:hypothetical protein